jgi:hypothetical protein
MTNRRGTPGASPAGPRPNVFVVGAAKCGTTSLHRLFDLCPQVGTARTRKELHFFSEPELMLRVAGPGDAAIPQAIIHSQEAYLAEHAHLDQDLPVIADVSPSYLQNPPAAERIRDFAPGARILILLRAPVSKVFSQYVHQWSDGYEELPFAEAWEKCPERMVSGWSGMFDYQNGGYYAADVKRYFDLFGRDRVLVLLFEEMTADMDTARAQINSFLGVTLPAGDLPRMNAGGRIRSPFLARVLGNEQLRAYVRSVLPLGLRTRISGQMHNTIGTEKPELSDDMRKKLKAWYAQDTMKLEALLGRTTGWLSPEHRRK